MKLIDLFETTLTPKARPETITSTSKHSGDMGIDQPKAQYIVDPRGYFQKNKASIKKKRK